MSAQGQRNVSYTTIPRSATYRSWARYGRQFDTGLLFSKGQHGSLLQRTLLLLYATTNPTTFCKITGL